MAFGRSLAKLTALAAGMAAGLVVLVAMMVLGGIWRPDLAGQPTPHPTTTRQAQRPAPTATPTRAAPKPALTPVPSAVRVNSLAEMRERAPSLRGQLVQVVIGEQELSDLAADYLRAQGVPASDVRVRVRPGQMSMTGNVQQSFLAVGFTVNAHPTVVDKALKLTVDSVEPPLVAQFAQVAPGQTIDLPLSFEADSVEMVEGQMVVTGVGR